MSVSIHRVYTRQGVSRYCVNFSSGMPVEFLIQAAPRPQSREWQVLYALELIKALARWVALNVLQRGE